MRLGGDQISHVITIGEDVTEWYRIHSRIMQNEKLAAVGQLAAGIMHEINNPLATIGACAAAIEGRLDEVPPRPRGRFASTSTSSTRKWSAAPTSSMACSTSAGPRATQKSAVTVNTVIDETFFLLKHHTRFKKLTVQRELGGGAAAGARQLGAAGAGPDVADAQRARRDGGGQRSA